MFATDIFQFEFPDLVLSKRQSGGVGHTELVSWSDAVMQLLRPVLDTLGLHKILCMYVQSCINALLTHIIIYVYTLLTH